MKLSDYAMRVIVAGIFYTCFRLFLDAPSWGAIGFALILACIILPLPVHVPKLRIVKHWTTEKLPVDPRITEGDIWYDHDSGDTWEYRKGTWVKQ